MKFTKSKIILVIIFMCIITFICLWISQNTGLKAFEKEVLSFSLPDNVEKIAMKSGIGDSGGNGDYSTYRVVLVVKAQISIDELKKEFEDINIYKYYYITKCENSVFESPRQFKLKFDKLEKIEDYSNYYYIEFIK